MMTQSPRWPLPQLFAIECLVPGPCPMQLEPGGCALSGQGR